MTGRPPSVSKDLYPFASHYLERNGHRLHYVDEGRGAPVLLLHGNPTWSFYYRRVIEDLRVDHRVIALDHLGCGLSDKPQDYPYRLENHIANVEYLVDALGLKNLSLVLHDWGGVIGAGYAVRHPANVVRWALMNTAAFWPAGYLPLRLRLCRIPRVGEFLIRRFNLFARIALRVAVRRPGGLTPEVRRAYLAPYDSYAHRIATARFVLDVPDSPRHPSYATAQAVESGLVQLARLPTRIFWGGRDPIFNARILAEWERRFPNAVVDRFPGAGHYVLEDAHEFILPRLREFLAAPAP